jgi:hypothetical protein
MAVVGSGTTWASMLALERTESGENAPTPTEGG